MQLISFFNRRSIRFKLVFLVSIITVFYTVILLAYFSRQYQNTVLDSAKQQSQTIAEQYGEKIKAQIEKALHLSRSLAQIFESKNNQENPIKLDRMQAQFLIRNFLAKNPQFLGIYSAWEANKFDRLDSLFAGKPNNHPKGAFVPYYYRDSKGNIAYEPLKDYLTEGLGDYFLITRQTKKETVIDPIEYPIGDRNVYLMTLVVPILKNNEFLGVVGTDISTEATQKLIEATRIYEGAGKLAFFSHNGTIVAWSGKNNLLGKKIQTIDNQLFKELQATKNTSTKNKDNELITIVPLQFGETQTPWYLMITVPSQHLLSNWNQELIRILLIGLVLLLILMILTGGLLYRYLKPIQEITAIARQLARGNMSVEPVHSSSREIHQLNKAFMQVVETQKDLAQVTATIASGDYSQKALVKSEKDLLAISVNQMIDELKKIADAEARIIWINEGYAKFSELLRFQDNLKSLCQNALQFIIQYLKLNLGGVFIREEEESDGEIYLDLVASYAYGQEKHSQKKLLVGEGLVGQAYLKSTYVIITELPKDYITIASGLGNASPNYILLIPLRYNEKNEGIMELASFKKLEAFEIDFIQRCANSLAAIIINVKVNELTSRLLQDAHEQAEQLKTQDEIMRQGLEELQIVQEEMQRKEQEYLKKIEILSNTKSNN